MANFQLGSAHHSIEPLDEDEDDEVGTRERRQSLRKKRHYKKDSRFLLDLYTLTFDENETVDEIATCKTRVVDNGLLTSFSTPSSPNPSRSSSVIRPKMSTPAPMSLNLMTPLHMAPTRKSIPSLETNLHKILARKFLDSEEVSFRKAKLLTKAYYQLLRTNSVDVFATAEIQQGDTLHSLGYVPSSIGHKRSLLRSTSRKMMLKPRSEADQRLSWPALLRADNKELARMVAGLNNTVKALNDYLMELLQERDVQLSQQDDMLEHISELTDNLL